MQENNITDWTNYTNDVWISYLPKPKINHSGTGCCIPHYKCKQSGLGVHDYKYTLISVDKI